MLIIALSLQASAPPVPPPPSPSLEAALAIWADHPVPDSAKQLAIEDAVRSAADEALMKVGIKHGVSRAGTRRYFGKRDILMRLLDARVPRNSISLDKAVAKCALDEAARVLSAAELVEVQRFMANSIERRFWEALGLNYYPVRRCYSQVLDLRVAADDYQAAGLRPPKVPNRRGLTYG